MEQFSLSTLSVTLVAGALCIKVAVDQAQNSLEQYNLTKTGKALGAGGNFLAGAMAGFGLGGLIGAVLGGVAGLEVWSITERNLLPRRLVYTVLAKGTGRCVVTKAGEMAAKKFAEKAIGTACKETAVKVLKALSTKKAATHITEMSAVAVAKRSVIAGNIVGIVADVAQVGLEVADHEKAGKAVGLTGNVASGALTGFALEGPAGAAVGAIVGAGLWAGAEWIGS